MTRHLQLCVLVVVFSQALAQDPYTPYRFPEQPLQLQPPFTKDHVRDLVYKDISQHEQADQALVGPFANTQAEGTEYLHSSGYVYPNFHGTEDYLSTLLNRIVPADLMARYGFRVFLFHDPSINAFTTSPGYIYVHPGMIAECDNEDELALILAHEVAHRLGNDVYESYQRKAKVDERNFITSLLGVGFLSYFDFALAMKFNRSQEEEADERGAQMACDAGFSVSYGAHVFKKFQLLEKQREYLKIKGSLGSVLYGSSHPSSESRFTNLSGHCQDVGAAHASDEFLRVRQVCRYEVLKMYTDCYDFRSSIASGWRYLGEGGDETLAWMTFDALRRLKLMTPQVMDETILASLYYLPGTLEEKLRNGAGDFTAEENAALEALMLGSDTKDYKDERLRSPSLTFSELHAHLLSMLGNYPNCADCHLQLALDAGNTSERKDHLSRYNALKTGSYDDHFIQFIHGGETARSWQNSAKTIVIVTGIDLTQIVTDGFITSYEKMEPASALSLFDMDERIKMAQQGVVRRAEFFDILSGHTSPRDRYDLDNYLSMLAFCRTNKVDADLFIVDPSFYLYCRKHKIQGIETLEMEGHCTEHGGGFFTLSLFETLKYKDFHAQLVSFDMSSGRLSIHEAKASKMSMVRKKSIDKMMQKLYSKMP